MPPLMSLADAQGSAVELAGHTDTIAAAAFDPTGATVATGGMDGSIRLWNSQTGEQQACLEGPSEAIEWLAWHPKGTVLLAGSEDMMAWMFNAAQQQVMQVFTGHAGPVSAGVPPPAAHPTLLTPEQNTSTPCCLRQCTQRYGVPCVGGFMPDGKAVVTAGGDGDGCIKTWNPKTGACTATIAAGHLSHSPDGVTCLAFAGDGSTVVSGGVDGSVVVSNIASGKRVAHVQEHADSVEGVAFANGLPLVVTASMDGKVIIWDTNAASKRGTCEHPEGVVHLAMQHRGPLFATACLDGVVRVFDVRTAQTVATFGGNSAAVQCVAWAPDDVHLLSGSDDHTARVFECPA